ncbi:helix-hairpin-helix domain-containing protein [Micromonospora sp. NPDC050686]|uniref:helix-hairpin-helix domain-containing protein n=1 Tax=Micromonospora sp. NPDC050686 TaxID=3154631 RepID=UPI0033CF315C
MPSTYGQWLIVILALLVVLAVWWVLRGRRAATRATQSVVEGDPVAGVAETHPPTEATVDQRRAEATIDEAPSAAVTAEPVPAEREATPAAAAPATPLPQDDTPAGAEVMSDPTPAAASDLTRAAASDLTRAAASDPAPVVTDEPVTARSLPGQRSAEDAPVAGAGAAEETSAARPPVVPAPRAATRDADLVETTPALAADPDGAAAPEATDPAAPPTPAPVAAGGQPAADDFRRIQGIGPKMAGALQAAGIRTYRQLADLDEAALRETIRAAGLRATASLATWPQQAKVLAGAPAEAEQVLPAAVGAGTDA